MVQYIPKRNFSKLVRLSPYNQAISSASFYPKGLVTNTTRFPYRLDNIKNILILHMNYDCIEHGI